MPITWKSVTAPNFEAGLEAGARGVQTIQEGVEGFSKAIDKFSTLQEGQRTDRALAALTGASAEDLINLDPAQARSDFGGIFGIDQDRFAGARQDALTANVRNQLVQNQDFNRNILPQLTGDQSQLLAEVEAFDKGVRLEQTKGAATALANQAFSKEDREIRKGLVDNFNAARTPDKLAATAQVLGVPVQDLQDVEITYEEGTGRVLFGPNTPQQVIDTFTEQFVGQGGTLKKSFDQGLESLRQSGKYLNAKNDAERDSLEAAFKQQYDEDTELTRPLSVDQKEIVNLENAQIKAIADAKVTSFDTQISDLTNMQNAIIDKSGEDLVAGQGQVLKVLNGKSLGDKIQKHLATISGNTPDTTGVRAFWGREGGSDALETYQSLRQTHGAEAANLGYLMSLDQTNNLFFDEAINADVWEQNTLAAAQQLENQTGLVSLFQGQIQKLKNDKARFQASEGSEIGIKNRQDANTRRNVVDFTQGREGLERPIEQVTRLRGGDTSPLDFRGGVAPGTPEAQAVANLTAAAAPQDQVVTEGQFAGQPTALTPEQQEANRVSQGLVPTETAPGTTEPVDIVNKTVAKEVLADTTGTTTTDRINQKLEAYTVNSDDQSSPSLADLEGRTGVKFRKDNMGFTENDEELFQAMVGAEKIQKRIDKVNDPAKLPFPDTSAGQRSLERLGPQLDEFNRTINRFSPPASAELLPAGQGVLAPITPTQATVNFQGPGGTPGQAVSQPASAPNLDFNNVLQDAADTLNPVPDIGTLGQPPEVTPPNAAPSEEAIQQLTSVEPAAASLAPAMVQSNQQFPSVPVPLIAAVARAESDFGRAKDTGKDNAKGAGGVMQLKQETANDVSRILGRDIDRFDPNDSVLGGTAYLDWLLQRPIIGGDVDLAIMAYNHGLGNFTKKFNAIPENQRFNSDGSPTAELISAMPEETEDYYAKVIRFMNQYAPRQVAQGNILNFGQG